MPSFDDYLKMFDAGGVATATRAASKSAKSQLPKLTEDERDDLLDKITTGALSGIQWVGETIDKPGRAVRGLLGGQGPEALANLVPFSDTMGLTDPQDSPTGRDLLENVGILGKNQEGLDLGDVGGFLAEVATDPLTWLTGPGAAIVGGAKAAARTGKLASKAKYISGQSAVTVAKQIRKGDRGLMSIKVPFADEPLAVLGKGETAAKVFEGAVYNPITAMGRQLFDHKMKGVYGSMEGKSWFGNIGASQKAADVGFDALQDLHFHMMDKSMELNKKMPELERLYNDRLKGIVDGNPQLKEALTGGNYEKAMGFEDFARALAEQKGVTNLKSLSHQYGLSSTNMRSMGEAIDTIDAYVSDISKFKDGLAEQYRALGGNLEELDDQFTAHFPRRLAADLAKYTKGKGKAASSLAARTWSEINRNIRDIPGGTVKVNQMAKDPDLLGKAKKPLAERLQKVIDEYGIPTQVADEADPTKLKKYDGKVLNPAQRMTDLLGSLPSDMAKDMMTQNKGLFTRSMAEDLTDYVTSLSKRIAGLESVHHLMANVASEDLLGPSVAEVLGQGGKAHFLGGTAKAENPMKLTERAIDEFKVRYQKRFAAENNGKLPTFVDTHKLKVPEVFLDTAEKYMKYHTDLKASQGLMKIYDKFLSLFKGLNYAPWMASHVRNFVSGLWQNNVTAFSDPVTGGRATFEAIDILRTGKHEFLDEIKTYGILNEAQIGDLAHLGAEAGVVSPIPSYKDIGKPTMGVFKGLKQAGENISEADGFFNKTKQAVMDRDNPLFPWNTRGVRDKMSESTFFLGATGEAMARNVEFVNRAAHYIALRRRGWTPAASARSVKLSHFDYSELSEFERKFMRRLIPFYTFSRKNLPHQISNILTYPGGPTPQSIRAVNLAREESGGFVPSWLGQGLAIPLGQKDKDTKSYFVETGMLPISEAFNRFRSQEGVLDVGLTGENILAQMSPAIAGPLQQISGRQFWSHRNIEDLYQWPFEDDTMANFWLHQSPAARALSTARMLSDERKSYLEKLVNMTVGGARVTDVDIPKTLNLEARDILTKGLKHDPDVKEFSRLYPTEVEGMDEETQKQLALYYALMNEWKVLMKERNAAKAAAGP